MVAKGGKLPDVGRVEPFTGSNPAAGSEISETVPNDEIWELLVFRCELSTDSTTADRTVHLVIEGSGGTEVFTEQFTAKKQDTTFQIEMAQFGFSPSDVGDTVREALPFRMLLPPGSVVKTSTTNLQSGDDFTAPTMLVERFSTTEYNL